MNDRPAPPELLWRKNLGLLVYLARSPRRRRTREHLRGLLWGEKPENAARHSLNEAIRSIRRAAGDGAVRSEGRDVALSEAEVELDTDLLERQLTEEQWDAAAGLVGGTFLEGFGVPDASPFEDWMAAERTLWLRHSLRALAAHAERCLERGDVTGAHEAAGRALALDPLHDAAARAAMRAAALAGDRAGALALYDSFAEKLKEAFGSEPEAETERLADRIRRERTWRLPGALASPGAPSRRTELVGREKELRAALKVWSGTRGRGRAGLLLLEGEAGVGKSRLLEEVASRARLDGATVAAIRAVPSDVGMAWSGLLGLCRGGLLEAPGLVAAPPAALAALCAELPSWKDRFSREVEGAEPAPFARAFPEILRPAAEDGPVLLCVDDADWIDPESARVLAAVLRDLAELPVMVAVALATDPAHGALDDLRVRLGRELEGASLTLRPLDREALRRLSAAMLPAVGPGSMDRLVRRVATDSGGLPFLAVELLNAVRLGFELGHRAQGEGWPARGMTLDQTLPGDLPSAVVASIRMGFRRLSTDAQSVLAAAAVLGDRCDAALLGRVAELSPDRLAAALDELEWERWLASEPRGYAFPARIVARVVGRDMTSAGRRRRILAAAGP